MEQSNGAAQAVAEKVNCQIKNSGVTVVWLCEDTGIPRATMTRRLRGLSSFNLNELERIAQSLRVDTADLLTPITERVSA